MRRILPALAALALSVTACSVPATTSTPSTTEATYVPSLPAFTPPDSAAIPVDKAPQEELDRRDTLDASERVAEMAYFGHPNHAPGNIYLTQEGMLLDGYGEIGRTVLPDGMYTLAEDYSFRQTPVK